MLWQRFFSFYFTDNKSLKIKPRLILDWIMIKTYMYIYVYIYWKELIRNDKEKKNYYKVNSTYYHRFDNLTYSLLFCIKNILITFVKKNQVSILYNFKKKKRANRCMLCSWWCFRIKRWTSLCNPFWHHSTRHILAQEYSRGISCIFWVLYHY